MIIVTALYIVYSALITDKFLLTWLRVNVGEIPL